MHYNLFAGSESHFVPLGIKDVMRMCVELHMWEGVTQCLVVAKSKFSVPEFSPEIDKIMLKKRSEGCIY